MSSVAVASSASLVCGGLPRSTPAVSSSFPVGSTFLPSHILVFTTDMANEAALRCPGNRIRLSAYHSMHPLVQQFMLQNGLYPGASASAMGGNAVDCAVTQEQLENRKCKMAQLEKIHSKLSKSKMASTPGAATVAAMQQQQMYAAAAAASGGGGGQMMRSLPPLPSAPIPPIQHEQRRSLFG